MKIKEGFVLHEVAGSFVAVPLGAAQVDFGGMLTLTPVGAFIWKCLGTDTTEEKIVQAVLSEYEVDEPTARRDAHTFLEKLRTAGLLED